MSSPRVAVVIPVHNGERYLGQALASVTAQTYGSWEAIVVDDASADGSLALAGEVARRDDRIRVVSLKRNVGVAEARNTAVRASGDCELVALLDQDDYWREDYLARTVELFDAAVAAGRRPGVVACNAEILTPGGFQGTFAEYFWWRDAIDYEAMLERNYVLARALFSRAAFQQVGGFDPRCLTADDYDLWLRLIEAGYEVLTTREPLVVYRIHDGGQSRDQRRAIEGTLTAYRLALARGAISRRQRRSVRLQIRHYRALQERAALRSALSRRRPLGTVVRALRAAPYGVVAFLQAPGRWDEWVHGR